MVKACISQKTNYVDITGETYVWLGSMGVAGGGALEIKFKL